MPRIPKIPIDRFSESEGRYPAHVVCVYRDTDNNFAYAFCYDPTGDSAAQKAGAIQAANYQHTSDADVVVTSAAK